MASKKRRGRAPRVRRPCNSKRLDDGMFNKCYYSIEFGDDWITLCFMGSTTCYQEQYLWCRLNSANPHTLPNPRLSIPRWLPHLLIPHLALSHSPHPTLHPPFILPLRLPHSRAGALLNFLFFTRCERLHRQSWACLPAVGPDPIGPYT